MRKLYLVAACLITTAFACHAQEFAARVRINDVQVQIADKSIFRNLENRLTEFLNNTKWSAETFQQTEKIEINIEIILAAYDQTGYLYKASAIIQSRRPVYGTTYSTTVFSFNDENFDFKYQDQDRMDFQEGQYLSDLNSLMCFYAYYTLAMDFDSYAPEGGTTYFSKAFQVANIAQQSSGAAGWKPFERTLRTRYNLIDNVLNERFRPLRNAVYIYHRKGMDQFIRDPLQARKQILAALDQVKKIYKLTPNSVMLLVFFEAKSDELVNIFKGAEDIEKPKAIELLSEINMSNITKYEKIKS